MIVIIRFDDLFDDMHPEPEGHARCSYLLHQGPKRIVSLSSLSTRSAHIHTTPSLRCIQVRFVRPISPANNRFLPAAKPRRSIRFSDTVGGREGAIHFLVIFHEQTFIMMQSEGEEEVFIFFEWLSLSRFCCRCKGLLPSSSYLLTQRG